MSYSFHPWAEAEFLEAIAFYESRVPGLGRDLIEEFVAISELISESPEAWRIVQQPDIRSARLNRFPFCVLFREMGAGFEVLAVAHDRRRPQYWIDRLP